MNVGPARSERPNLEPPAFVPKPRPVPSQPEARPAVVEAPAPLPPVLRVSELARAVDAAQWNDFAQLCGGSMRSASGYLKGWSLKHRARYRLRMLEIHADGDGGPRKIGQCAFGERRGFRVFIDKLQILPGFEGHWDTVMRAVLAHVGPGEYRYGWELNLEPPREDRLRRMPGVVVDKVRPLVVEVVDFSRWPSWDEYWRAVSKNSRRNAKKAQTEIPDLSLVVRSSYGALTQIPALLQLRSRVSKDKGLNFRAWKDGLSHIAGILSNRSYALSALAVGGGRPLAAFYGFEFGARTDYLNGGSEAENGGAAWFLMLSMLQRAYEKNPVGKFVMGYVDHALHDDAVGAGLLRSRRACRAVAVPTSVVTFRVCAQA